MLIHTPKTKYEQEIYKILKYSKEYADLSNGEKSIIYDLVVEYIPKYVKMNWNKLNLKDYILKIADICFCHSNDSITEVVYYCIEKCFKNYKVEIIGGRFEPKKLNVQKISIDKSKGE